MNERIKELRKALGLTQEKFGDRLGIKKNSLSQLESGTNSVTDQMAKSICREFNVNEEAFRTGEGWPEHMFKELPEEDEDAAMVYDVLMDKENPFYRAIVSLVKTYRQLTPENQEVLRIYCEKFLETARRDPAFDKTPATAEEMERRFPPVEINDEEAG